MIYIVDSNDRERIPESKETFGIAFYYSPAYLCLGGSKIIQNIFYLISDKMIANKNLAGVPLLVLANKQDIPHCMGVREVKPIFDKNAHLIGQRDCMVMPVSALNG